MPIRSSNLAARGAAADSIDERASKMLAFAIVAFLGLAALAVTATLEKSEQLRRVA
jgi:hypothetical protein